MGIEPFILRDTELERQGFGGIYGVGKAAPHPPALAVLSHTPVVFYTVQSLFLTKILVNFLYFKGATKTIAWVGKGIVYDTGGLSIKGKVC